MKNKKEHELIENNQRNLFRQKNFLGTFSEQNFNKLNSQILVS